MSINKIVAKQYRYKVNRVVSLLVEFPLVPQEGWLRTVRKALGMSVIQQARRQGVSRARVAKIEQDELAGKVTLRTMQAMAAAMNCKFVYAIVPLEPVEEVIKQRALEKARQQVYAASVHMALEAQTLTDTQLEVEVTRVAQQLIDNKSAALWDDE